MKNNIDNQDHGQFTSRDEVRIVRLLPGPIERVWDFLTDPEKRARWFCGGAVEQRAGGKIEFAMHSKKLAPDETPPAQFAHVHDPGVNFEGKVLKCEPPRLLVFTFGGDDSEVTFELSAQGKQVQFVLTHRTRGDEERSELKNYAAGWHTHVNLLVALLEGAPRPAFWPTHTRLRDEYTARYGALPQD